MFEKKLSRLPVRSAGHKGEENVGRLKTDGYSCPNCGDTRNAGEFARAIKEVEDSVEKLKREFARVTKIAEVR